MSWTPVYQSLSKHRKTLRAVALLGVDRHKFIGHLLEFWWWAIDNVPTTGDLGIVSDGEIAGAADWQGDPAQFVAALTESGFIDSDTNGRHIHEWENYGGKVIEKREHNKHRMREERATHVQRTDDARATHVAAVEKRREEKSIKPPMSPLGGEADSADAPPPAAPVKRPKGRKADRPKPQVSEEFIRSMEERFGAVYGNTVRERIEEALSHEAAKKYDPPDAYVRKWLRDDAKKFTGSAPIRNGNGYRSGATPGPTYGPGLQVLGRPREDDNTDDDTL